jgi:hypothetical protein
LQPSGRGTTTRDLGRPQAEELTAQASTKADASALSKLNSWRLLKLIKIKSARSRLYRRRFLQVNTGWKALAEIYTMHSFAPLSNLNFFVKNRQQHFAIE